MRLWGHASNFEAHWLGQDGAEGGLANPQVEKKGCLILGMTQVWSEEQGSEVPMRMELRTASLFIAGWTSTSGYMWPRSWVWRCNSRWFVWMTSQHLCYAGSGLTSLKIQVGLSSRIYYCANRLCSSWNMTSTILRFLFAFDSWQR